ncbi:MAG: hypothetical protein IJX44_09455 [Bacteroidaceae bacterium]|nr:hypothetical protein [Bacteroidaceae bacterium]
MESLMKRIYYRFDYDGVLDSWGRTQEGEYEDLFVREQRKYDKRIVHKAFADAITGNDTSIIKPYLTNPVSFSCYCYRYPMIRHEEYNLIDKEEFIKIFSEYFENVDVYSTSIIPTGFRQYYGYADVLVKTSDMKMGVHIQTFLNSVYDVYIFEEPNPML